MSGALRTALLVAGGATLAIHSAGSLNVGPVETVVGVVLGGCMAGIGLVEVGRRLSAVVRAGSDETEPERRTSSDVSIAVDESEGGH